MRKITTAIIIVLLLIVIRGITLSIQELVGSNNQAETLSSTLVQKKQQNEFLKQQLSFVKSDPYIENQARNKLGLVQPGERIVIVPTPLISQKPIEKSSDEDIFKEWVNLFK